MRRLLLGIVLGAFVTLVGMQAAHAHETSALDSCSVCALAHQAHRQAPGAAPVIVRAQHGSALAVPALREAQSAVVRAARARAPPPLS